jgi:hypothetical protein
MKITKRTQAIASGVFYTGGTRQPMVSAAHVLDFAKRTHFEKGKGQDERDVQDAGSEIAKRTQAPGAGKGRGRGAGENGSKNSPQRAILRNEPIFMTVK